MFVNPIFTCLKFINCNNEKLSLILSWMLTQCLNLEKMDSLLLKIALREVLSLAKGCNSAIVQHALTENKLFL